MEVISFFLLGYITLVATAQSAGNRKNELISFKWSPSAQAEGGIRKTLLRQVTKYADVELCVFAVRWTGKRQFEEAGCSFECPFECLLWSTSAVWILHASVLSFD